MTEPGFHQPIPDGGPRRNQYASLLQSRDLFIDRGNDFSNYQSIPAVQLTSLSGALGISVRTWSSEKLVNAANTETE